MQSFLQPEGMLFSGCFPDGVIENILIRLPLKSLFRFKTVRKSWRDFLSCAYFAQMQLDHAQKSQKLLLYSQSTETYIPDISIVDKTNNNPVSKNRIFTPFQFNFFDGGVIEDSFNGLLSFRFKSSSKCIYLWNPATRESRRVKLPYMDINPCVGIAFVAKINDYKMVRIPNCVEDSKLVSIWVYSLNSDTWKELNLDFRYGPLVSGHAVSVHGCMHWITEEDGAHIAAFDVENELLRYLELPSVDGLKSFTKRQLGIIRGSLSVVTAFSSCEHDVAYEVWQMSEYGVGNSWEKVCFIAAFREIAMPLWIYNDRILFTYYWNNNEDVFSYDPFTRVKMYFHLPACLYPQVMNYTETLASLECESSRILQERPIVSTGGENISLAGCTSHGHDLGNMALASGISDGKGKAEETDVEGKCAANQKRVRGGLGSSTGVGEECSRERENKKKMSEA